MKTLLSKNPLKLTFALLLSVVMLGAASCSKSDKKDEGFPRTLAIEYKVTSTSGLPKADLHFTNETGGQSSLADASLPFSKKLNVTMSERGVIALSIGIVASGNAKLEILHDGKVVKTQTFSGNDVISGTIDYGVGL
ncbi:hypothetical protein HHL16_12190 [Pseudoflavitalea sp. G-6-1-2]|uniref:hypothetical protein n=1 Tax=Pseudoflavitalea sp. G-6-1-2 TaxID=2728841 RepID=UPI00146ADAF7|nr:hypothetical protein [Pseudoflavitalea sp. G-6-1-2]NML21641.1 hypothetical protein [Pseudoflavitalea sp. G-6-1-2]